MKVSIVLLLALGPPYICLAGEGIWTTNTPMPTARYVIASSVVNGTIYVMGGDPGNYSGLSTVEAYDPAMDTWAKKADMPMPRGGGDSGAVNGMIYYFGGSSSRDGANLSSVLEYNPTTDSWATKANPMPTPRTWLSGSAVNGKIYAIGGALTHQGAPLSTVEEYDPATDTWTRKADMPTARVSVCSSAVNGKIYAIGGSPGGNQWLEGLSTVEEYDPATDTWTNKASMPTPRTRHSTCVVNGKIHVIGGFTSGYNNSHSRVEVYDPETNTWTSKADMPTARYALATSAVNGKIYAIGGWSTAVLSTVEEYDLYPLLVDFNADGIVDAADICIMVDYWGTDEPLCDIGPMPWGDGVVDAQDLIVLAEHLFTYPGAVAYWKLDETEGTFAYDSAGDNDALLMGDPAWQPDGGIVDGAIQFDGTDDYVVADFVLDPSEGPFSVFAWVQGGAPGQVILSQADGANWLVADALTGTLMTSLSQPAGRFTPPPFVSETIITDGDWHRVGFVWDGMNRSLYVDDVLVAEDALSGLAGSNGGLHIGCAPVLEPGTFFSGRIDDVRIYNRAIAPATCTLDPATWEGGSAHALNGESYEM